MEIALFTCAYWLCCLVKFLVKCYFTSLDQYKLNSFGVDSIINDTINQYIRKTKTSSVTLMKISNILIGYTMLSLLLSIH
jgi:hypothetical protein